MEQVHPFKLIRISNQLGQKELAEVCSVTPQVILRTEQGLYGMPSVKVLRYLATLENSGTVAELETQYKNWQTQHRLYNKNKVEAPLKLRRAAEPYKTFSMPELKRILGCASTVAFCKLICVHPSQVDRYTRLGGSLFFLEEALRDITSEDLAKWVVNHLHKS